MTDNRAIRFARWFLLLLPVLAWHLSAVVVQADERPDAHIFDSVSFYEGQGVNHNLRELPGKIITGQVDWDKTYFSAAGFGKVLGTLGQSSASLQNTLFASIRHGYELIVVQHRGLQDNAEVGGAWILRTPDAKLGVIGVNGAAGIGLSYALGTPDYEDGPRGDPERRYRLQLLALFEIEWFMRGCRQLSLVTRVHHRSGAYGLIAPQNVGSNFLAAGIRYTF